MRSRRKRVSFALLAFAVAVGLVVAGWTAASAFRSPEQIAANASPPPPSVVTAPVKFGTLQRTVEVTVRFAREREATVSLPPVADAVVTRSMVEAGATVSAGALLAELNGGPVFLLEGEFRYFRNLRVGDAGTDVAQLQTGLRGAGFDLTVDGRLGAQTVNAVARLLQTAGYVLPSEPLEVENNTDAIRNGAGSQADVPSPRDVSYIPATLFVVAREAPATVVSAPAVGENGEEITPLVLSSGDVTASAAVMSTTASLLTVDMTTVVTTGASGIEAAVSGISAPAEDGSVTVTFDSAGGFDDKLIGSSGTAKIHVDPPGEKGLIVPARAVVGRADGTSVVQRRNDDRTFSEVRVTVSQSAQGRSLIELVDEHSLKSGDEVRVE